MEIPQEPPLTPEQALEVAVRLHQGGRLAEAEQMYRELLKHSPNHPDALFLLGMLFRLQNKNTESINCLVHAVEAKPDFAEAWLNLGNALRQEGQFHDAINAYSKALEIQPRMTQAHNNLGLVYRDLKQFEEAGNCYLRALEIEPDMADTLCNLGNLYRLSGKLEEAEAQYRRAIEINDQFIHAHNSLGNTLRDLGKLEEAETCLRRVVTQKPDYALGHYNLALALKDLDRTGEAVQHYQKAVELDPDFAQAHNNLGNLLKDQGRVDEALTHYRRSVKLDPKNASAQYLIEVLSGRQPERAPDDYIQALFRFYSPRFDRHLLDDLEYRTPQLLRSHVSTVRGEASRFINALDLGCGTGLSGEVFHDICDHMTGVDLSPAMLEEAGNKQIYDVLREAEILDYLNRSEDEFDLIVAADVLVYLGDLSSLIQAIARRLLKGGLFLFSTEAGDQKDWEVLPSGRFRHAPAYIEKLAEQNGLQILHHTLESIRRDRDSKTQGGCYTLQRF